MTTPDPAPAPTPDPSHVGVESRGPARWIRLERPEKRNAMTRAMAADLRTALTEAVADEAVRVVVLTGAGSTFSSGADTKDLFGRGPSGPDADRSDGAGDSDGGAGSDVRTGDSGSSDADTTSDAGVSDTAASDAGPGDAATSDAGMLGERRSAEAPVFPVDELVNCPKPTIVALNGPAVGGGATMVMAADLRVCASSASLAFTLGKVGLTPEWGSSYLLWRQIGWGRTLDVLLTARPVDATEALAMGLVSRVVDDEALERETQALAEAVAALPAGTAEATKDVLRHGLDATYADARRHELRTLSRRGRDLAATRRQPPPPDPPSPHTERVPPVPATPTGGREPAVREGEGTGSGGQDADPPSTGRPPSAPPQPSTTPPPTPPQEPSS
jgi:enoyl-CoA hydratase/carnithine racemase